MKSIWKKMTTTWSGRIISLLVLGAAAYFIWARIAGNDAPVPETATVKRGDITESILETGNVKTAQLNVFSSSTGVVEEIFVKNGDQVKIGQKLFRVRSTSTEEDQARAYASYMSAQNSLKVAEQAKTANEADLLRNKTALTNAKAEKDYADDHDENPSTNEDYTDREEKALRQAVDAAESALSAAQEKYNNSQVNIASAAASVTSSRLSYEATKNATIIARSDGTVGNLSLATGDTVYASDITVTNAATISPVLVIGAFNDYKVEIQVNEIDRTKLFVGQKATIALDALAGKSYEAVIDRIDDFGTDVSGVILYKVTFTLKEVDPTVRPLMTASVNIETAHKENALLVPNTAIKPYKGAKAVQIIKSTKPDGTLELEYIPVTIGLRDGSQTEILDGVSEGVTVVISSGVEEETGGGPFRD